MQARHIFNQYVIRVNNREQLREYFKHQQIGSEIYYPVPMHLQECFADLGYSAGNFPESELAANTSLALPIFPELTGTQKQHVVDALTAFCEVGQVKRQAA